MNQTPKRARNPMKVGFDRFTEHEFEPYVKAIGQLALAWNSFHEVLAWTFEIMMAGNIRPADQDKGPQVREGWNLLNSDREKRKLLLATVTNLTKRESESFPQLAEDVRSVLDRANELEDARNNAVHSPLMLVSPTLGRWAGIASYTHQNFVAPEWFSGNRRAVKLREVLQKNRKLLDDFRWCRDATLVCRDFMVRVNRCWGSVGLAWPKRPSLPNRGAQKTSSRVPRRSAPSA